MRSELVYGEPALDGVVLRLTLKEFEVIKRAVGGFSFDKLNRYNPNELTTSDFCDLYSSLGGVLVL